MYTTTQMNLKIIMLSEIKETKGHVLYDSIYMKCPEKVKSYKQKADWWLKGTGAKEMRND